MMSYSDGVEVEAFDRVEIAVDDHRFEATVLRQHPRDGSLHVEYMDELDCNRSGDPRRKTTRVPVGDCELLRRDG